MSDLGPADIAKNQIEYWKQVIVVLTHFNDMCIRTRWFGLTVITTMFAGAALAMSQASPSYIDLLTLHIPISSVLFALAAIVCVALWQLDEKYYFKMLMASVEHAHAIEPAIVSATGGMVPDLTLTHQISKKVTLERAQSVARWFYGAPFVVSLTLVLLSFAYHAAGHSAPPKQIEQRGSQAATVTAPATVQSKTERQQGLAAGPSGGEPNTPEAQQPTRLEE